MGGLTFLHSNLFSFCFFGNNFVGDHWVFKFRVLSSEAPGRSSYLRLLGFRMFSETSAVCPTLVFAYVWSTWDSALNECWCKERGNPVDLLSSQDTCLKTFCIFYDTLPLQHKCLLFGKCYYRKPYNTALIFHQFWWLRYDSYFKDLKTKRRFLLDKSFPRFSREESY